MILRPIKCSIKLILNRVANDQSQFSGKLTIPLNPQPRLLEDLSC